MGCIATHVASHATFVDSDAFYHHPELDPLDEPESDVVRHHMDRQFAVMLEHIEPQGQPSFLGHTYTIMWSSGPTSDFCALVHMPIKTGKSRKRTKIISCVTKFHSRISIDCKDARSSQVQCMGV